jgi:hypothetical protein
MQKTFIALSLSAVVALGGAVAAPASAASLKAHRVIAHGTTLGQADATTFAYSSDADRTGSVVLRGDDGRVRTVAAPAGCRVSVAQNGLLAGECGPHDPIASSPGSVLRHLFVARLDGSAVTRLDTAGQVGADGSTAGPPSSVGAQWIGSPNAEYHGGEWTEAVNWHTGEVREDRQIAAGTIDDVNAPDLQVPLCAPIERVEHVDDVFGSAPGYFDAQAQGPYVLLQHADGHGTVRRCGSTRPVRLPRGFDARELGGGWAAGAAGAGRGLRIEVVRLADGRRRTVTGIPRSIPTLTFARGRLYLSDFAGSNAIYTVKLPW